MSVHQKALELFEPIDISRQDYKPGDSAVRAVEERMIIIDYLESMADGLKMQGEKQSIQRAKCIKKLITVIENAADAEEFSFQDLANGKYALTLTLQEYEELVESRNKPALLETFKEALEINPSESQEGQRRNEELGKVLKKVQTSARDSLKVIIQKLDDFMEAIEKEWNVSLPRPVPFSKDKPKSEPVNEAARLARRILRRKVFLLEHEIDEDSGKTRNFQQYMLTLHDFLDKEIDILKDAETPDQKELFSLLSKAHNTLKQVAKHGYTDNRFELAKCLEVIGAEILKQQEVVATCVDFMCNNTKVDNFLKSVNKPSSGRARRAEKQMMYNDIQDEQSSRNAYLTLQSGLIDMIKMLDKEKGEELHAR